MPRDLFGDVVVRSASTRARRSPLLLLSLGFHGAALVLGLVGSLVATGALPTPRRVLAYQQAMLTVPAVDIELPSSRRVDRPRRAAGQAPSPISAVAAPVIAPVGVSPENPALDSGIGRGVGDIPDLGPGGSLSGLIPGAALPPSPPVIQAARSTAGPVRLHAGIRAPQKVLNVDPAYPAIARTARVEGVVILEATIDTSGAVTGLAVLRPVALLDQAAVEAVRQWRFTPALLNGEPVAVIMTITVRFTLGT